MWTPKRVLILLGGFVLFSTLFGFYSHFLGYIDGLPELPRSYWAGSEDKLPPLPPEGEGNIKIFRDAFGDECEELARPIRVFLRAKGLAFATKKFEIDADKRVKLTPCSAVIYGKIAEGSDFPEINTVRSEVAYLTLDKPVASLSELHSRKIVAIELKGKDGVTIKNNHRTREMNDDISVDVVNGSLFYSEPDSRIWTDGFVTMLDGKTNPPTKVMAQGMDIHLVKEGSPAKSKAAGKGEGINGVEWIVLKKNVEMHLYMDPQSGFLADSQKSGDKNPSSTSATAPPPGPPGLPGPADKAHVIIKTDGEFRYDLTEEKARFQCDKNSKAIPDVVVTREHTVPARSPGYVAKEDTLSNKYDKITCDDLLLYFRQKPAAGNGKKGGATEKEIATAVATGKKVTVSMETESLDAEGDEMTYHCATDTSGPETTIKGNPMLAMKDGHKIFAPELHLVGGDKKGFGQHAEAHGPGQIDMFDSANPKIQYPHHAVWSREMSFTKIFKNDIMFDRLILKGDARFEDDERQQKLSAQELFVWLEPTTRGTEPAAAVPDKAQRQGPMGSSNQRLHRLDAKGEVTYFAPDIHIEKCDELVINTEDKIVQPQILGKPLPLTAGQGGPAEAPTLGAPVPRGVDSGPGATLTEPPLNKKPRPIQLWAEKVLVNVFRVGSQYEMNNLTAQQKVHVKQEGETAKDKGVDITGNVLHLVQLEQGKILDVDGDEAAVDQKRYGRLMMNDMVLVAPKISINQVRNFAQGEGPGYLNMPSNSNLDGSKTAKPDARMTVYWNERMQFNGTIANFFGAAQAEQEGNKLRCQNLQVTMDRPVSFKEGQKDTQAAKVDKIVCDSLRSKNLDRKVFVFEQIIDERTHQLIRQQMGEFIQLEIDNGLGLTRGSGPGYVASFSKDSVDPRTTKTQAPSVQTTKLTLVEFIGRLSSVTKDNTRKSKFYDNVDVYHLPAARPDIREINRTTPPKGGFYLNCHLLEIYARPVAGKTCQEMIAKYQVTFRTDEFFCRSDVVKFDEADDVVIFEANPGSFVRLTKLQQGNQNQAIDAEKILYNRKTGVWSFSGARQIESR